MLRGYKVFGITTGILVVVVGFTLLAGGYDVLRAANDHDEAMVRAHAAGIPASALDLARKPIPDEQNAAVPFKRVVLDVDGPYASAFGTLSEWRAKDPSGYDGALRRAQPVLAEFENGAKRPHCNFGDDFGKLSTVHAPKLMPLILVADTLCAEADARAEVGDVDGAVSRLMTVASAADRIGEEPFMFALLVQATMRMKALDSIERIVARRGNRREVAESASRVVEALGPPPDVRRALAVEAWMGIEAMRPTSDRHSPVMDGVGDSRAQAVASIPVFANAFQREAANHWASVFEALPKDPANAEAMRAAIIAADRDLASRDRFTDGPLKAITARLGVAYQPIADLEARRRGLAEKVDRLVAITRRRDIRQ